MGTICKAWPRPSCLYCNYFCGVKLSISFPAGQHSKRNYLCKEVPILPSSSDLFLTSHHFSISEKWCEDTLDQRDGISFPQASVFGRTAERKSCVGTSQGRLRNKVSLGIAGYENSIVMQADISQGLRRACCRTETVFCMAEIGLEPSLLSVKLALKYSFSDHHQPCSLAHHLSILIFLVFSEQLKLSTLILNKEFWVYK